MGETQVRQTSSFSISGSSSACHMLHNPKPCTFLIAQIKVQNVCDGHCWSCAKIFNFDKFPGTYISIIFMLLYQYSSQACKKIQQDSSVSVLCTVNVFNGWDAALSNELDSCLKSKYTIHCTVHKHD